MKKPAAITIAQYADTNNGKALRKLFGKYMKRKTVPVEKALEYLCVSELYFALYEGNVRNDEYLPDGFQDIPPKEIMDSFIAWGTSDYCADVLSCSENCSTRRYNEIFDAFRLATADHFGDDPDEDDEPEKEETDDHNPTPHRVNITDIDWDTSYWDSELTEGPHSANVPDLPTEIEDAEIEWDDETEDPEEVIGDWLSDTYGFCVNSFSYEENVD